MASAESYVFVGAGRLTGGTVGGLFRQRVGDDRWERVAGGLPDQTGIQAVTVHPTSPGVVFAGALDGPYRSDDGGATWKRGDFPRDLQVWAITVHPTNPRVVYAGTSPTGVFRSEDGGDTWRRLPNAVQPERIKMGFACRVMRIAIVAGATDEIYAALEVGGAMRSLDGGESWMDCSGDLVGLADRSGELNGELVIGDAEHHAPPDHAQARIPHPVLLRSGERQVCGQCFQIRPDRGATRQRDCRADHVDRFDSTGWTNADGEKKDRQNACRGNFAGAEHHTISNSLICRYPRQFCGIRQT